MILLFAQVFWLGLQHFLLDETSQRLVVTLLVNMNLMYMYVAFVVQILWYLQSISTYGWRTDIWKHSPCHIRRIRSSDRSVGSWPVSDRVSNFHCRLHIALETMTILLINILTEIFAITCWRVSRQLFFLYSMSSVKFCLQVGLLHKM